MCCTNPERHEHVALVNVIKGVFPPGLPVARIADVHDIIGESEEIRNFVHQLDVEAGPPLWCSCVLRGKGGPCELHDTQVLAHER